MPTRLASRGKVIGELIGYVGQNPFVFAGTIAENIAYGCEGATDDQIRRAAERACIHDEIMAMPGGYDAHVAERGQNLSGGQKQRIALARVFLKNPPILILDEGTSALDNISERLVQQAINAARADRTVILVAHRLSTLREADRILVFDDGRIVETGTYCRARAARRRFRRARPIGRGDRRRLGAHYRASCDWRLSKSPIHAHVEHRRRWYPRASIGPHANGCHR